jgi:hypothetical protein
VLVVGAGERADLGERAAVADRGDDVLAAAALAIVVEDLDGGDRGDAEAGGGVAQVGLVGWLMGQVVAGAAGVEAIAEAGVEAA